MDQDNIPQPCTDPCGKGSVTENERKFSRYFLLALAALATIAFLYVIKIFVMSIILAAVFAALFFPLNEWLLRLLNGRRNLSALLSCIILFLGLLIPVFFISNLLAQQAVELYQTGVPRVNELLQEENVPLLGQLRSSVLFRWISVANVDWRALLQESAQSFGGYVGKAINATSRMTLGLIANLFVILYSMFYFFRDGKRIVERVKYFFPLSEQYKEAIMERFVSISRAAVRGTLLIGLIQGGLGALTLLIFGVSTWLLWGIVMVAFSVLPVLGTWTVLVPAGIIMMIQGEVWQGVATIIIGVAIIGTIDNILRPRLVGREAGMHDLLIFFSTLGGITVFGFMGFIIGPVIAAIFLTVLDIYGVEFKPQLTYSGPGTMPSKPGNAPPSDTK
jgi:predicted PurR-regulated permease PerM